MGLVRRDELGRISSWVRQATEGYSEQIADDSPELVAFLAGPLIDRDAEARKVLDAPPSPAIPVDVWKMIKALAISFEAQRLNKTPQQLTGAELAALRNRIAAIFAAL